MPSAASCAHRARATCTSATATMRARPPCRSGRPVRWRGSRGGRRMTARSATSRARWCRASRDGSRSVPSTASAPGTGRTPPPPQPPRSRSASRPDAIGRGIASFTPAHHRGEVVALVDGVRFVDNSKATNVHAALAALEGVRDAVLIAGGRAKGVDLSPLRDRADRLAGVVAIGESAREVGATFDGLVPVRLRRHDRGGDRGGVRARAPARDGAPRAGLRQLGHVPGLRGAGRPFRRRRARAGAGGPAHG